MKHLSWKFSELDPENPQGPPLHGLHDSPNDSCPRWAMAKAPSSGIQSTNPAFSAGAGGSWAGIPGKLYNLSENRSYIDRYIYIYMALTKRNIRKMVIYVCSIFFGSLSWFIHNYNNKPITMVDDTCITFSIHAVKLKPTCDWGPPMGPPNDLIYLTGVCVCVVWHQTFEGNIGI